MKKRAPPRQKILATRYAPDYTRIAFGKSEKPEIKFSTFLGRVNTGAYPGFSGGGGGKLGIFKLNFDLESGNSVATM